VIYLETSALVKLIRIEIESDTLDEWLNERTEMRWITSPLTEFELPRAIRAVAPEELTAVPSVPARLDLLRAGPGASQRLHSLATTGYVRQSRERLLANSDVSGGVVFGSVC
jgi:predicted nucleic acid-binding protein